MKTKFYIRVPGTSANLGPGFDLLGLALKIYNEFYFSISENSQFSLSLRNGDPLPFETKDNLIEFAYRSYFQQFLNKETIPGFDVEMKLGLPLKGGLGSSASALVAGFKAAHFIHKNFYKSISLPKEEEILYHLAMLEGHPDNTTPAYLGGFVFSYFHEKKLIYFQDKFPNKSSLFLFIPEIEVETNHSRKKLPETYCTNDVVFNMGRISTWIQYLRTGNFKHLELALEDRIHTSYRMMDLPVLLEAGNLILKYGACYSLSGSGPTLLIYTEKKSAKKFFANFLQELQKNPKLKDTNFKFIPIETCQKGTILKTLK